VCFASASALAAPTAEQLSQQLSSSDVNARREAIYQLGKMGPEAKAALPALIKAADDNDKQVWSGALNLIADLGPAASEAVPALLEGLDSRKAQGGRQRDRNQALLRTANALANIGPAAVPALSEALTGNSPVRKTVAARALGQMGPDAKAAVPVLLKALEQDDDQFRHDVSDALGQIGAPSVPGLIESLQAQKPKQRQAAALALAQIGSGAKSAEPALLSAAEKETDDAARGAILAALTKTGVAPDKAAPLLLKAIRSDNAELHHAALNALLTSRATERSAIGSLTGQLSSKDPAARQQAAQLLGRIGPAAVDAVPALVKAAQAETAEAAFTTALAEIGTPALPTLMQALSQKGGDRKWVFRALNEMGAPALTGLAEALHSPTPTVRAGAASALDGMPLEKHPAVKTLLDLTGDKDPQVRAASLRTLAGVRSDRPAVIPKLEAALNDPDAAVRKAAAIGLANAGAVEKVGAQGLIAMLSEPDPNTRKAAVQSLGTLGEKAKPALPELVKLLQDPEMAPLAAETLGHLGDAATGAVPGLIAFAKNGGASARSVTFPALGAIGPAAAPALPLLYESLNGADQELALPAMHAIARVESDDKLIPLLTQIITTQRSGRVRRAVCEEYKRLGDRSKPAQAAIPTLITMLEIPTERSESLQALRAIQPTDLNVLQPLLDHKEPTVRGYACDALAKLGPQAAPALEKIRDVSQHDKEDKVRQRAKSALAAIERKK
jgi:HEAT repeat protein